MEHLTINHERLKYSILREIFYEIFLLQSARFAEPKREEGLHKPLYQCKSCGTKYQMESGGTILERSAIPQIFKDFLCEILG